MTVINQLKNNILARLGILILLVLYISAIGADFIAPYDPYSSQTDGSLLPPTRIYWRNEQGNWTWPYIYPTTQSPTNLQTGERGLNIDKNSPSKLGFGVKGSTYNLLGLNLDRHLFGVEGKARLNLLGTDEQGRDQFSRLLYGGRVSLFVGLLGILISFPIGMIIGGISGYFGGWIDSALMRFVEILMTIPSLYLLVALAGVLPLGLSSAQRFILIVLITSLISWSGLARVIRGQVLSLKQQEFVQAAKAMGASPLYIIWRHILPQTASYIIISATLSIPSFIIAESVLSFLGLGIQQPDPSWGNLLSLASNASVLVLQPWLIWPPTILISLTVLAFNLLGDSLRDALDPRSLKN
jgi:peptide/nickel transport system permease protein